MEISDIIRSFTRRKKQELKQELINGFVFAQNTAELIGRYLNKDNKARNPWDFFPELFADEKKLYEKELEKKEMETLLENRRAYSQELKRRRELGLR